MVGRLPRYNELTDNAKLKNGTSGVLSKKKNKSMLPAVVAGELLMKILVLADVESKYLWDYFRKGKIGRYRSYTFSRDLKPQYLSFLASFSKVPILYVHGNHDDCYDIQPPDGCINIEDKIYVYKGVRIMGLGGSIRYKKGKNQYTQKEMNHRINKMWLSIKKNRGFDILLTFTGAGNR